MAFGQTGLVNLTENRQRFYNAIALKDSLCLAMKKSHFIEVYEQQEKRIQNEKIGFLKSIPELNNIGMTRSKLIHFCSSFVPVSFVKKQIIFNEGDPCKYLYFVRQGEVKICKRITFPNQDNPEKEEFAKLLENPATGRKNKN